LRRFILIGQKAASSEDFSLDDLPGTSGRLDVLLRSVRAAMLTSHGLRPDVVVYLVLLGGARAPRTMRFDSSAVKFLRPDERALATLARKVLASRADEGGSGFASVKAGIMLARGGLDVVLADLGGAARYVLEEGAPDVRAEPDFGREDVAIFVGDHTGFSDDVRAHLDAAGARPMSIGPVRVHADDAVAIVQNELDRREAREHARARVDD
jgi:tRNA (pseudouridine54-N1)-methyltransferase